MKHVTKVVLFVAFGAIVVALFCSKWLLKGLVWTNRKLNQLINKNKAYTKSYKNNNQP